ncbi:hypothetical protein [Lacrimispora sphenoides]|uniref:hypothetical protein n=1 Tax=Lacrimispora sphenoides TaxID=29370 RepID=UPI00115F9234|nr:hypothetical protein [Lacrimispora sphenoides]
MTLNVKTAANQNKRRIIMISQYKKTPIKWTVIMLLCLILLNGCSSTSSSSPGTNPQDTAVTESSSKVSENSVAQAPPIAVSEEESVTHDQVSSSDNEVSSFEIYFNLLGLSKQELNNNISEKPEPVDEGGLEYKETGIRVWFNSDTGIVNQVFTQREDLDFKGAKIGDKAESFQNAFGEPISDQNGDMHFKYKDGYISVIYDTQTGITFAVYLLNEDF